jgi:hypothetical protein
MEALAEQVIQAFLVQDGKVFVSPGYNLDHGRACPDFVALDFGKKEVVIVEVTTAYKLDSLFDKIKNREDQWFKPLRGQLDADGIAKGWEIRFLGFVRQDRLEEANKRFVGDQKVSFAPIERCAFSWENWERRKGGLPHG